MTDLPPHDASYLTDPDAWFLRTEGKKPVVWFRRTGDPLFEEAVKTLLFEEAVETLLIHEGGYSNDPNDAGGETKYGISARYNPGVDIKNLTKDEAKDIYYRKYWLPEKHYRLMPEQHARTTIKLFVSAVLRGPKRTGIALQRAVRAAHPVGKVLKADGAIGPKTLEGVEECDPLALLAAFKSELAAQVRVNVINNPHKERYLKGWLNRAYAG